MEVDEDESRSGGYDYLLTMQLWSLTKEKVEKLENEKAQKNDELAELLETSIEDMWKRDLDEVLVRLDEHEARENDILKKIAGYKKKGGRKGNRKKKSSSMMDDGSDSDYAPGPKSRKKPAAKRKPAVKREPLVKKEPTVKEEKKAPRRKAASKKSVYTFDDSEDGESEDVLEIKPKAKPFQKSRKTYGKKKKEKKVVDSEDDSDVEPTMSLLERLSLSMVPNTGDRKSNVVKKEKKEKVISLAESSDEFSEPEGGEDSGSEYEEPKPKEKKVALKKRSLVKAAPARAKSKKVGNKRTMAQKKAGDAKRPVKMDESPCSKVTPHAKRTKPSRPSPPPKLKIEEESEEVGSDGEVVLKPRVGRGRQRKVVSYAEPTDGEESGSEVDEDREEESASASSSEEEASEFEPESDEGGSDYED